MKILLAEDDLVSRMMLSHLLESWGHQVLMATNGVEALGIHRREDPDVVISDWHMPRMTGLELCRRIREQKDAIFSYFILLTAREGSRESLDEAYAAGIDDFVAKQCHPFDLQARLRVAQRVCGLEEKLKAQISELGRTNEKMKHDLRAAARIQEGLLPTVCPKEPGWGFAWKFVPCEELAGDFLNVISLGQHRIGMFVLDVSGHGVAAALMSVTLSRLLSATSGQSLLLRKGTDGEPEPISPAKVLQTLNAQFQITDATGGQYFTICYGILDAQSNSFRYAVAGHPPGLVMRRGGGCELLEGGGLPIGFIDRVEYDEWELCINPGDRVYLYSDGLTEAPSPSGEEYGMERLRKFIPSRPQAIGCSVGGIVEDVMRWHKMSKPEDDISLLAFERSAMVRPRAS